MKISTKILNFAGGEANSGPYRAFVDYWNHFRSMTDKGNSQKYDFQRTRRDGSTITFDEKEIQMNQALRREILRHANISNFDAFPLEQWITNPMISWATFAVVNQLVDMVLPDTIIDSIGLYTDVRQIDWGDSAAFEIKPRDLFIVSKAGRGMRTAEVHKQFNGQVTLVPQLRELTVQVSLYKVLAGKESLGDFVAKVIRSLETDMAKDAYTTFNTAMTNLSSSGDDKLKYAGYSQADLITLAQKVSAWNGGNKAVIVGTPVALLSVLPDDANYRYALESDYVKIGYINNMATYDILSIPQIADYSSPFKMLLDDTRIYVLSPTAGKIVKMVIEGSTMSNVDSTFSNANLNQNATLYKSWASGVATSSIAGILTLP
jgi:hypothetical protein